MATFNTIWSDSFINQSVGVITGTFGMSQLPAIPGKIARLQARSANAGSIYLGRFINTGTFPLPWELAAGGDTGWFPLRPGGTLADIWQNGSSGSSYMAYWVMG